jgi:16S rRNA (uracil1498-N3)-methyltransferase
MTLFYAPEISSSGCTLNAEESTHCVRVLRHAAGDNIRLTDGLGFFYEATIITANPKACVVEITSRTEEPAPMPFRLHIAVAPPKNAERLEWFIEKATEIGISQITPIICEHSERGRIKHERLMRILISAMKQSERATLPVLSEATAFSKLIEQASEEFKFIAHCEPQKKSTISEFYKKSHSALVLIGPEGDFSVNEINQALQSGFSPISLGKSRLRTETAALAACTILNFINE